MATTKKKTNLKDIDDMPSGGSNTRRRQPSDTLDIYQFPNGKYVRFRMFGQLATIGGHWVKTIKKDGSKASFYMGCAAFDPESAQRIGGNGATACAYCAYEAKCKADSTPAEKVLSRFSQDYFGNAILRSKQKAGKPEDAAKPTPEEKSSGFKDKESDSWTPVVPVRLTFSGIRSLKELKQLNVSEDDDGDSKAYSILDAENGCDVSISKDKDKPAAQMYAFQKGEKRTPLTEAESRYLIWDLSDLAEYPTTEEVAEEFNRWAEKMGVKKSRKRSDSEDDEDEEDLPKRKKRNVDDFDEDEEEDLPKKKTTSKKSKDDDFDEDEEEDEKPVKKKPAAKKKVEEDDDFDDDEDDDPPPKKKPAAKKKSVDDDDDDFDDDVDDTPKRGKKPSKPVDDFDEDEEDEKPVKKKTTAKKSKDDDFDEDEEEDEKPVKKKPVKKPARDEDEDEEEDERPARKTVKKKRPVDDDDEDL